MSKTGTQEFTSSWSKTVNWARQSGIPQSAYYPVYQLDSQRLLQGDPMSESDRIRAIQAAAGLDYSNALPTDAGNPANVLGNIKTNAADIFTGLNPVSLVKNIFDTVTHTIEDPASILHPLSPHSIASWIPGVTDLALLMEGKAGLNTLLENPLTSLLDVLPIADYAPGILAGTQAGAEMASRLGITTDELGKMSVNKLQWALARKSTRGLANQPLVPLKDAAGQELLQPMTWGDRIDNFRNAHGIGSTQSHLMGKIISLEQKGTKKIEELVKPAIDAIGKLSNTPGVDSSLSDRALANHIVQTDFRAPEAILTDDSIPQSVRTALEPVFEADHKLLNIQMDAEVIKDIPTIVLDKDGNEVPLIEKYLVTPGSRGAKVSRALDISTAAKAATDAASKKLDFLLSKVTASDKSLNTFIEQLHGVSTAIYQSIKRSIPDLPDAAAERARNTLPAAERWDRAVPANTIVLRNLLGLGPDDVISLHAMNAIRDLFQPAGLIDQMYKAYDDQDWISLNRYSKVAARKFDNKIFDNLPGGTNGHFLQVRNWVKGIQQYSVQRQKLMDEVDKIWHGARRGVRMSKGQYKKSVEYLTEQEAKAHQNFIKVAIANPPDVWDSAYLTEYTRQVMASEKTASLLPQYVDKLASENEWADDELSKLRSDPRTIIELMKRSSKDAYANPMMPDIPVGLDKEISDNAYSELSSLRARGLVPHYIPSLNPNDNLEALSRFNFKLSVLRPVSESARQSKIFDFKPSIFDIQLGLVKGANEALHNDILEEFHNTIRPLLHDGADIRNLLSRKLHTKISMNSARNLLGGGTDSTEAIIQQGIKDMGLVTWDPESVFGNLSGPKLDAGMYINKDIADALKKQVQVFSNPAKGFYEKGTRVFRYSILGLSPRFTAHILFGGTYLVALRAHVGMAQFLGEALRYAKTGEFSPDIAAQFPHAADAIGTSSTQEGTEDITFHRFTTDQMFHKAGMKQLGHLNVQEYMANHPNLEGAVGYLKAAANINFRFTRAITRFQKAVVYLDGAKRAMDGGEFYDDVYDPQLDINGNEMYHPITGKQLFNVSRKKIDMTPEQIHEEGMRAVQEVMGDLRNMTPLERSTLVKLFPFYGWTKHILSYVMSYPSDHPYRATFLSQLATQNSADVSSGLPTRIQLLFFLGQPDAEGNVTAVDDRFMDPLRDVANYASWTGLFESLNPILSAPLAAVDPNISFGGTPLYPNITYDSLYGTKEAGPQGNLLNSVEQVVPEVTALDVAFNLSGQYSYLHANNPEGFAKKIYESLNVPFLQVQHINLRQIAAKDEMDRYTEAENDAFNAVNSGDFSTLDKYPAGATVPDPLGTGYNVSVAYLKALYNETEKRFGLPPTEALPSLPQPQI